MKKTTFSASFECAHRLIELGCPLDYAEDLPKMSRRRLYIEPLDGYAISRLLDLGEGSILYIVACRLGTDLAGGAAVSKWGVSAPWAQHVTWDFEPRDILPKEDWPSYRDLLDSRLLAVLNGRGRVYAGRPVAGLICGQAYLQSVPKSLAHGEIRIAELTLSSTDGGTVTSRFELRFERLVQQPKQYETRHGRLFEKPDMVPVTVRRSLSAAVTRKVRGARPSDRATCALPVSHPYVQLVEEAARARAGR